MLDDWYDVGPLVERKLQLRDDRPEKAKHFPAKTLDSNIGPRTAGKCEVVWRLEAASQLAHSSVLEVGTGIRHNHLWSSERGLPLDEGVRSVVGVGEGEQDELCVRRKVAAKK